MKELKGSELRRVVHSREGGMHLCYCCALDVMTQGPTEVAARRNLTEAVMLFHESCTELGSRDELFRELGFCDTPAGVSPPARCYSSSCPCRPEED
jgi:predicted RNase H-like HicB family nuclease